MDASTRDLERASASEPDNRAALLRWCASLRRIGALTERASQEALAQRLRPFNAATKAWLLLDGFGIAHGHRHLTIGQNELEEFDFKLAGFDWTVQCWMGTFEPVRLAEKVNGQPLLGKFSTPTGHRIDLNIFGPSQADSDGRGYQDVSLRTFVRLLSEPPQSVVMYDGWNDAGVMDDDPDFQNFARELTQYGVKFERNGAGTGLCSFGGYFDFEFEGKKYSGAWNANYPRTFGPSADIFTRESCADGYRRCLKRDTDPKSEMRNFTHPLDVIEALRRPRWGQEEEA